MNKNEVDPSTHAGLGKQVGQGALWALAGQSISAILSVANFAVVSRHVLPTQYGNYLLAMVVLSATQWLALNAYREPVVQAKNISDNQINSIFLFSAFIGLFLSVIMLSVGSYFLFAKNNREVAFCIAILSAKLFLDTTAAIPAGLKVKYLNFKSIARISVSASCIGTLANIGMLFSGFGIYSLALSQSLTSLLALALHILYGSHKYRLRFKMKDLKILTQYSYHVILWQAIEALNQTIDRMLIAARISMTDLGFYGFGRRLNDTVIDILVGATSNVSLPAFSLLQNDHERLQAAFLKAVRIVTLIVLPLIAILHVTAADFIPLVFGKTWSNAVPIYRWFLLLGVIQTIGILQGTLIRSLWRPGLWSKYTLIQSLVNVAVVLITVHYGIQILAASIVIRTYLIWTWAVYMTCRLLEISVIRYATESLRPALFAVIAGISGYWILYAYEGTNHVLRMLLSSFCVLALYCCLATIFMRPGINEVATLIKNMLSRRQTK